MRQIVATIACGTLAPHSSFSAATCFQHRRFHTIAWPATASLKVRGQIQATTPPRQPQPSNLPRSPGDVLRFECGNSPRFAFASRTISSSQHH